jgi:hypothetical protein
MNLCFFSAAAGGFDIKKISNIVMWIDASDPNALYTESINGTLVEPNSAIGLVLDKSGNQFNLTQSLSVNRPIRRENVQNSLGVIEFNTQDYIKFLTSPSLLFDDSQWSVFTVYKFLSASEFNCILELGRPRHSGSFFGFSFTPSNSVRSSVAARSNTSRGGLLNITLGTSLNTSSFEVQSFVWNRTNATLATNRYLEGSSTIVSGNVQTPTTQQIILGSGYSSGVIPFPDLGTNIQIAEIIIIKRNVSPGERTAIEEYLNRKWNLY